MGGRKKGLDGGEQYGRENKDWMEENSIGGRKNGLDGGEWYGRKEKRAGCRKKRWEKGIKDLNG